MEDLYEQHRRCWSPKPVALPTLTRVAGLRWPTESCFQLAKGHTGLDQHRVRTWTSWHRNTTLVLVAFAFLAVLAARQPQPTQPPIPTRGRLSPLSVAEIRRLLTHAFALADPGLGAAIRCLTWRLTHQARARHYHYKRRAAVDLSQ